MKIILIGFMGSGKTTVAKSLSTMLGKTLVDMDEEIVQKTNCATMNELFNKGGEVLLRETEIAIAKEHRDAKNLVMATGGGIVMNQIALKYLQEQSAQTIFLHASFSLIMERLKEDHSRPLLNEAKALYDLRIPLYLHYADRVVSVENKSIEEITKEIMYGK